MNDMRQVMIVLLVIIAISGFAEQKDWYAGYKAGYRDGVNAVLKGDTYVTRSVSMVETEMRLPFLDLYESVYSGSLRMQYGTDGREAVIPSDGFHIIGRGLLSGSGVLGVNSCQLNRISPYRDTWFVLWEKDEVMPFVEMAIEKVGVAGARDGVHVEAYTTHGEARLDAIR